MHILNLFLWNKCHLLTMLSLTLSKKAYMHAYPEFVPLKQMSSADYVVTYFIKKGIYACISWICSFETNVICWLRCHLLYQNRHICMHTLNLFLWNKCHLLTMLSLTLTKKAYMHAHPEFLPLKQMPTADHVVTYFIEKGISACISGICSFETNVICWLRCNILYQTRHTCMHSLNLFLWNKWHLLNTLSLILSKKHICMHILILFLWNKCHLLTTLSLTLSKRHMCMHILNLFLWNKCHLLTTLSLTLSKKAYMHAYPEFVPLKQMSSADYVVTYFIEKGIYACISWIC